MSENSALSNLDKALVWFAGSYADKPYVRALFLFATGLTAAAATGNPAVAVVPAAVDTAREMMASGVQELVRERQKVFFDELEKGEQDLNEELVREEDFLHSFASTYSAAMKTRQREKIRRFARLLLAGIRYKQLGSDQFEEFLATLDDLSERELALLLLLKLYEDKNPRLMINLERPDRQRNRARQEDYAEAAKRYWPAFMKMAQEKFGEYPDTIGAMLNRLTRTGLYRLFTGWGAGDNLGMTTTLFEKFTTWIEIEHIRDL